MKILFSQELLFLQTTFLTYNLVTGESRSYVFQLRGDLSNTHSTQNFQFDKSGKSLLSCAHSCVENVYCLSIFFNEESGECSGRDVIYTSSASPGVNIQPNFSYWEVDNPYDKVGCIPMVSDPGYCIKLHTEQLLVNDQISACSDEHMDLASLPTIAKHQFVMDYLTGIGHSSAVGVSASKANGSWLWADGTSVNMAMFGPSEPTNGVGEECVLMAAATGFQLNDAQCSNPRSFLCDRTIYK